MEITMDLLDSLTSEDMEKIGVYNRLLAEARAAVKAIHAAYSFKICEDEITIWEDDHNAEYLNHDGTWKARYLHQTYNLNVTVDSVFSAYKAEYEQRKHPTGRVNGLADSAEYFRSFVRKAEAAMGGRDE